MVTAAAMRCRLLLLLQRISNVPPARPAFFSIRVRRLQERHLYVLALTHTRDGDETTHIPAAHICDEIDRKT